MAPACAARRLPLLFGFICYYFALLSLLISWRDVTALLTYNCQTLLDIRQQHQSFLWRWKSAGANNSPPFFTDIPSYLRRTPFCIPRKKRSRRRGKRAGVLVRIKALQREDFRSSGSCCFSSRWILPVVPGPAKTWAHLPVAVPPLRRCQRVGRGVELTNLRPLSRASIAAKDETTISSALINTRSLANKNFILNNFFISRELDFMFLTETWLRAGDFTPFSELLPPDCGFFSAPRSSGKGGGVAVIHKSCFTCRQLLVDSYSSFEAQLVEIKCDSPVLCVVIYRPPKRDGLLSEFADFLSMIVLDYDQILFVGDFNIHICCKNKPLASDFLNLISSFNFTQIVSGSTHEKGHTLDLVLTYGLHGEVREICDSGISDHLPVLSEFNILTSARDQRKAVHSRRIFNTQTASQFSAAFIDSQLSSAEFNFGGNVDQLLDDFNSVCSAILDDIAPFKTKRVSASTEPWLNELTRTLRRT
ncbi:uncharacterized protein LOC106530015 [Austrofundulus limnaeus]|uniref:Uncharacterized protein LOC106530015 n=1 Tax=Austrofundulus limnaeus TaxID=52670 RepID=A0A2I4CM01_AUSLI|nr:PREDICTED: uncharacterized protein LOC106530015 [Austrofundulus limnaeus]